MAVERQYQGGVGGVMAPRQLAQQKSPYAGMLDALNTVTGIAAPIINQEVQRQVNQDKVESTKRALAGLDPNSKTEAGLAAHKLVDAQRDMLETQARTNQAITDAFARGEPMTEEEIRNLRRQAFGDLLARNPDVDQGQTISRFLTLKGQEAAASEIGFEQAIREKWEQQQNDRAAQQQVNEFAVLPQGMQADAYERLIATGKALNQSPEKMHEYMFKAATQRAEAGDDSVLNSLRQLPATSKDPRLDDIHNKYREAKAKQDAVDIGASFSHYGEALVEGQMTEQAFLDWAKRTRAQYGDKVISDDKVEGWLNKAKAAQKVRKEKADFTEAILNHDGKVPLGADSRLDPKAIQQAPAILSQSVRDQADQREFEDEGKKAQWITSSELAISEEKQIKMPAVQNAFDVVTSISAANYEGGELPKSFTSQLALVANMDPRTAAMYASDEQQGDIANLKRLVDITGSPEEAIRRLQHMKNNPAPIPDKKDKDKYVKDAVQTQFPSRLLDGWFGLERDLPKTQRAALTARIEQTGDLLMRSGSSPEVAYQQAAKLIGARTTRLHSGAIMEAGEDQLIRAHGFQQGEAAKLVDQHIKDSLPNWIKQSGVGEFKAGEVTVGYTGGMAAFRGPAGNVLGRMSIDEMKARADGEYDKRIREAAGQNAAKAGMMEGVDWSKPKKEDLTRLFDATVQTESNGNPNAVSKKGAQGLMQLMPATAPEAAKLAGVPYDASKLKDPEYNRKLGEAYLSKQLKDFGDSRLALAAYNAGPTRIRRLLGEAKAAGRPQTFASISSKLPTETRNYVAKVRNHYNKEK